MLRESPRSAVACGSCVRERYHHKTLVGHNLYKDSRELEASIMLRESLRSADACGSCVRARYHYPDVILTHCEPKGVGPPHFAVLARNYKAVTVNKNIKLDSLCRDISIWQPLG